MPPRSSAAGPPPGAGRWAGSVAWPGPGVARAPRALWRKAVGVGACHIRPAERPLPQSEARAAPLPPRLRPFPRAPAAVLPHAPAASPRVCRKREGLCETCRESASSPQDGGRHHRDSPRRAPCGLRKGQRRGNVTPGVSPRQLGDQCCHLLREVSWGNNGHSDAPGRNSGGSSSARSHHTHPGHRVRHYDTKQ